MSSKVWSVLLLAISLAVVLSVSLAEDAEADVGPMVTRPSDSGPFGQGWVDGVINTSTKSYDTPVRYYYPAVGSGQGRPPDHAGGPYPCVLFLPGFGGPYNSYIYEANHLTSWGMVVVTVGVNWNDWPNSANEADMEDFLDHLETLNATPGETLYGMVDRKAFGLSGHSSGGGISLVDGAFVDRIKAVQTFAAAISLGAVDDLALTWDKPLMLQVGQQDASYIAGSRRAYSQFGYPNSLVEIKGGGHGGPFQMHLFAAFYLYHLGHQEEYWTFLYGSEALTDVANGVVDLWFKVSQDHYFPFTVSSTISTVWTAMDSPVTFTATIEGYPWSEDTPGVHEWDIDGDLSPEASSGAELSVNYTFTDPGVFDVVYSYTLGDFHISATPSPITVANVAPHVVVGPDREVDHDSYLELYDGGSWDTPSDNDSLVMYWTFSDGFVSNETPNGYVLRRFTAVGRVHATLTVRDRHNSSIWDVINIDVLNVAPVATTGQDLTSEEDRTIVLSGRGEDTPSHVDGLRYRWDFGDGTGSDWSSSPEAYHSYALAGEYTATFRVKDPEGDEDSVETAVRIRNLAPVGAIVEPLDGAELWKDDGIGFVPFGNDTPSDLDLLTFRWDFGDGNLTEWLDWRDSEAEHTYRRSGEFTVTLEVRDDDGEVDTVEVAITVHNAGPVATVVRPWPSITVEEDSSVSFVGWGTDSVYDEPLLVYEWLLVGEVHEGDSYSHTFPRSGTYEAFFRVTDPEGAEDVLEVVVVVLNVAPVVEASLSPLTITEGGSVNLSATGTDTPSDQEGLAYSWDLGDGNALATADGTHTYGTPGTYHVTITVTDDDGETATETFSVVVNQRPEQPPDEPDDGDDDGGGVPWLVYGGVAAAVVLVVILLLVFLLVLPKRAGSEDVEEGAPPEDGEVD